MGSQRRGVERKDRKEEVVGRERKKGSLRRENERKRKRISQAGNNGSNKGREEGKIRGGTRKKGRG